VRAKQGLRLLLRRSAIFLCLPSPGHFNCALWPRVKGAKIFSLYLTGLGSAPPKNKERKIFCLFP
jgi:hypothetical protein